MPPAVRRSSFEGGLRQPRSSLSPTNFTDEITDAELEEEQKQLPGNVAAAPIMQEALRHVHFRSAHEEYSSGWRQHAMPKTQNLADKTKASGAVVKAIVDMDKRTLAFKVNDEDAVDAKVELPASVRPFILISQEDDTIRMSVTRLDSAPPA